MSVDEKVQVLPMRDVFFESNAVHCTTYPSGELSERVTCRVK